MLETIFKLKENHTTIKRECLAGVVTFMTMAYIIFVQPAVLSQCGMDFGAVMGATCIASAIGCLIMGVYANYPIALAPAMGHNFYFVFTVCLTMGISWQVGLGANFISGMIFLLLSIFAFREKLIDVIPQSMKLAIAGGIGLLIALIGFQWSGIIVAHPGTMVTLGDLRSPVVLLAVFGLFVNAFLLVRKIRGAFLIGMLLTTVVGIPSGLVVLGGVVDTPPSLLPTLGKLNIMGAFSFEVISVIIILFFLDVFDTVGSLVGIGEQGGFMKEGKLPRAKEAFLADAVGTVSGTVLGTTTVTSYIESTAGIVAGGRTGLTSIMVGILFLLSLFFYPLVKAIGSGIEVTQGMVLYPITSPVLILIGSMMMHGMRKIEWNEYSESIPAFLTLMVMPLSFSITEGISFGFISYTVLKLCAGKWREVHPIVYVCTLLFIARYIFL